VGVLVRERLTRMFRSADVRDAAVGAR